MIDFEEAIPMYPESLSLRWSDSWRIEMASSSSVIEPVYAEMQLQG